MPNPKKLKKVKKSVKRYADLLHTVLSDQNEEGRSAAEASLQQCENNEDFYPQILLRVSTAWNGMKHSVEIRELATAKFHDYIKKHFAVKSNGIGQLVIGDLKKDIVELVLPSLGQQNDKIRDAYINVIGTLVKCHRKTIFAQVLPILITQLDSDFTNEVLGAIAVIERLYDQASEKEHFNCSKPFIPKLVNMIKSNSTASECRSRAIRCLRCGIDRIACIGDDAFNKKVICLILVSKYKIYDYFLNLLVLLDIIT